MINIHTEKQKLTYTTGKHVLTYDTKCYDFRSLVAGAFEGFDDRELENLHQLAGIESNLEKYRQVLFSLFRSEQFQQVYKSLGAHLIDSFFSENALLQKTPTIRIQIPGAESTSYHSDGWYGHGTSVRSFWVPMTKVCQGNTLYMAKNKEESLSTIESMITSEETLTDINLRSKKICEPFEGGFGNILTFSSDMIHGANRNDTDFTRVTFDFRIAPDPKDIGTKPISNFYYRKELSDTFTTDISEPKADTSNTMTGITYSNLCGGVSAKSQLMLCAAFCEANNINIVGNESEIVTMSHLPVMRHYITSTSSAIDTIVVFGIGIFNQDPIIAEKILSETVDNKKTIIFCAEGIFFNEHSNKEIVLHSLSSNNK